LVIGQRQGTVPVPTYPEEQNKLLRSFGPACCWRLSGLREFFCAAPDRSSKEWRTAGNGLQTFD
jgi:hypothetical protein